MRIRFVVGSLMALVGVAPTLGETPLGTAFTYQGQLKQSGVPLDGTVDFEFTLWDDAGSGNPPTGGTQVGGVQAINALQVTAGLFTATLNPGGEFGGTAFNGNARWVQIAVRSPAGVGGFTTLAPRQPITPTPYAGFALNASTADTATTAINATQMNGQDAAFYQNVSNINSGTLDDQHLSSNVALLEASQTFAGTQTFSAAPSFTNPGVPFTVTSATRIPGLNADRLDGLDSTEFLQSIPKPLTLSGVSDTYIILGENTSTVDGASGVTGEATGGIGATSGVFGRNISPSGSGVLGLASAPSGSTNGVYGLSYSSSGRGVYGLASLGSGETYGVYGQSNSTSGKGVFGLATAATGPTFGVWGQSASTGGVGLRGYVTAGSGITHGVYGSSASPDGRGVAGEGLAYGVTGSSNGASGRGVLGFAGAASGLTYGVYGQSNSTSGLGVYGLATAASGNTFGVNGQSNSTSGRGVFGVAAAASGTTYGGRFESASTSGLGVFGFASAPAGSTYGVYGENASTSGFGVFGFASAAIGGTRGVYGRSDSTGGLGVFGWATAATGTTRGVIGRSNSTSGRGVYGFSTAVSGTIYGVYGEASTAAAGYAVYANGDMGASGTKPFRIDHPDDPANKYLLHYAVESPEVINFYRGTVVLDSAGEAVVELPHYFAKINKSPSYQLTAVGAPMPMLHVAEKISESALSVGATAGPGVAALACSFRIAGGVPGGEVSWEVKAVRNDLWVQNRAVVVEGLHDGAAVQTRAMPVEIEKEGLEKGTYQHPELYGLSAEMGMNYDAERERPAAATSLDATPQ